MVFSSGICLKGSCGIKQEKRGAEESWWILKNHEQSIPMSKNLSKSAEKSVWVNEELMTKLEHVKETT